MFEDDSLKLVPPELFAFLNQFDWQKDCCG